MMGQNYLQSLPADNKVATCKERVIEMLLALTLYSIDDIIFYF